MANLFKTIKLFRCQQIRNLPRFSQSFPDISEAPQVITPTSEPVAAEKPPKIKWNKPVSMVINPAKPQPEKQRAQKQKLKKEPPQPILDEQGNLIYTKMENKDARIVKIMSSLKAGGKHNDSMLLEGKRLITEALQAGCQLEYILFSRIKDVTSFKHYLPKTGRIYKVPYREMQIWSDLTTSPGIMGVFKIPPANFFEPKDTLPLTVICDNVREPSNLGAILRTSSGVGCRQVILTKGCVNVWEPKVLRSACGAHFKVKMSKESDWDGIKNSLPENSKIFVADNNTITTTLSDNGLSLEKLVINIPVLPYSSIDFKQPPHIVLIIGGETEGISEDSYKLAQEFNGIRINVPLSNGVESLNTGTALGIIAFEIKRQLSNCS